MMFDYFNAGIGFSLSSQCENVVATRKIIYEGNSFVAGTGATAGQDFPALVTATLGSKWTAVNHGVGGLKTPDMTTNQPAGGGSIPLIDTFKNENWVWFCELTNDIALNSASGTTAYNNMITCCTQQKTADPYCRTIVNTCIDRVGTADDSAFVTAANTANSSLRTHMQLPANQRVIDILVDWGAMTGFAPGARNAANYFDGIHPNDVGYPKLALAGSNAIKYASVITPSSRGTTGGIWTAQPGDANTNNGSGLPCGMAFKVLQGLTVSSLGLRYNIGDVQNHVIKLWASSGSALLASGTVLASSALDLFRFRHVAVTPVALTVGPEYRIAVDIGSDKSFDQQSLSGFISSNVNVINACYGDSLGAFPANNTVAGFCYGTPDFVGS